MTVVTESSSQPSVLISLNLLLPSEPTGPRLWLARPPRPTAGQDLCHLQGHGDVADLRPPARGGPALQGQSSVGRAGLSVHTVLHTETGRVISDTF